MVIVRMDNQLIQAESDILISEGEIYIDGEVAEVVFPGKFNIELVEGVMSVNDEGDILYESEWEKNWLKITF